MTDTKNRVLILGSAPSAMAARDWARSPFTHIVAINNAWRIRQDWDFLIHPEDFPTEKRPERLNAGQKIVSADDYVPRQNEFGGFVYAGGTMAFTAGYWALSALRPEIIAYFGCDMVYDGSGQTHFYGTGSADPLRDDITLRSLEAKSARLGCFGALQSCRMVRLSDRDSRLVYPSVKAKDLSSGPLLSTKRMIAPLQLEAELGYYVPSGRYWEAKQKFELDKIDALDQLWLSAYQSSALDAVA
ncbi:hypothetical protein [uncultured Ruegeria sp.]|uniref:hypothetical protein n=1 Tax=uncultured Ruegeria sp. TaxID=259304 RepID=UPI00262118D3|nr:hypothetical protein [uncultured Ruegeria sp.]